MTISTVYSHGSPIPAPEWPADAADAIAALTAARADFSVCRRCHEMSYGTYGTGDESLSRRIAIMSIGGIGNEILDDSNESALAALGEGWAPDAHTHSGVGATVCIDPAAVDADTLADMIRTADAFADYPVLDEADYSAREWDAFAECFRASIPGEYADDAARVARAGQYAQDIYYGYSDPGYISPEHVAESFAATAEGAE